MFRKLVASDAAELKITGAMRLVLAASALLIIYIDPSQPDRYVTTTYATLALYTLYSVILYILALVRVQLNDSVQLWSHWADLGWYLVLIALSSGTDSIFFMFLFFSVMIVSFRWGFRLGLWTAAVSSILFIIIGYEMAPPEPAFELNRFLLRPVYLLVLGYMIAYRGGYQIKLQQKLGLLREISALSNPRFGIDRTIGSNLERLRTFYDADSCISVATAGGGQLPQFRSARRGDPDAACRAEPIPADFARQLLALPKDHAFLYAFRGWGAPRFHEFDVTTREHGRGDQQVGANLAELLGTRYFITIPTLSQSAILERLYLTAGRDVFRDSDIEFLIHVVDQIAPVLRNIQLVDRLATSAAEEERKRIARDIHDSIIQPYIGLKIGLASVHEKMVQSRSREASGVDELENSNSMVEQRMEELLALTETGISDLRAFVGRLRHGSDMDGSLPSALKRFTARFADATGIETQLEVDEPISINDRLAAEVFQMVAEGLSNIRRHTHSSRAVIRLGHKGNSLLLEIENEIANGHVIREFTPRSIAERAGSLQGSVHTQRSQNGGCTVVVEIPL
jgi:signal transduction histidine kinase